MSCTSGTHCASKWTKLKYSNFLKLPTNSFQLQFKPSSVLKLYEYLRHLAYNDNDNEEISKFEFN